MSVESARAIHESRASGDGANLRKAYWRGVDLSMLNRVMKALKGEEKLWVIYVFWLFAGNMTWIGYYFDSVYIDHFLHLDSRFFKIAIAILIFYFPFSIFLLWRNSKNSPPLKVIATRLLCAILVVVYIPLARMAATSTFYLKKGTEFGLSYSSVKDGFMPVTTGNTVTIYINKEPEYLIVFY